MIYLVTNKLRADLVVDDIGLRFGPSETKTLPEQTFRSSRKIGEFVQKGWVGVAVRSDVPKPAIPVWPFSAAPAPQEVYRVPAPTPAPNSESVLQSLVAKLESIIGSLQAPLVAAARTPAVIVTKVPPREVSQTSDEPMFIPSQILPDAADVNINVATSETKREDYDAGLEALKNARKRK